MSTDATVPNDAPLATEAAAAPRNWKPLTAIQRRVAGVLVEKAKTTPEQYPLSLNALTNGCNQKSNRDPQMNLVADQIEPALEQLREMGAVVEVQSGGRVPKYKHCLYEWLGVDKAEMAVMAELMLRGEQTVGELRGRAARMEPIADVNALLPILRSLIDKGLLIELTPEGRGQVVAHALYHEKEMAVLRERYRDAQHARPVADRPLPTMDASAEMLQHLQFAVAELRAQLESLQEQVRELRESKTTSETS